ncbi:NAD-dependent epimerase/dehydratase family protein [Actinoalloteichus caeruleus]|uniref:NAD-dependent epimerase/dehydratase family protein n=1 Tax=Actinoalloteichus cyanogriseus TaxID=2893586 RepID=UPI001B7FB0C0|nr:NAD-dependent epimerase/dehydratase family protein [Actinoalloteichus caeruleus]
MTGSSGFLGHAVVAELADRGHEVVALVRPGRPVPPGVVDAVVGDVRDVDSLRSPVSAVEAVCHLAALVRVRESLTDPVRHWRTNTGGTLALLTALAEAGAAGGPRRLVLASTCAVYGVPGGQPIDEDTPEVPVNAYGGSKLAADRAAADLAATGSVGAISLRSFNLAGAARGRPDPDPSRLVPAVLAARTGRTAALTINGDGSAVRDFVHVEDMADAFALAVAACAPGRWRAYTVGSGRRSSVRDVVDTAARVTGGAVPLAYRRAAPEPPELVADHSRITRELGWEPRRSDLPRILRDGWEAHQRWYPVEK